MSWGAAPGIPAGLFGVIAIDAGDRSGIALKADGTIVTWPNASVPPGLEDIVAVAAGRQSTALALRSDGTVKAWGIQASPVLNTLTGVDAIAAATFHHMALKKNGTVVDYGLGSDPPNVAPSVLSGVIAISAGTSHSLALKSDGTVAGWNGANLPSGLVNVSAIAGGGGFSLLVTTNPPQPRLAAARMENHVALASPVAVAGYILEGSEGLGMPYTPVDISPNAFPGQTNNGALMLPISGGQKFFRLRKVE